MNPLERVEELIARIEASADPNVRAAARDLVQALMDFHGSAVARMLELTGNSTAQAMGRDEIVRPLLLLYGLHPETTEVRVRRAIDRIRNAECLAADEREVKIRVSGHAHAVSRDVIEKAIQDAAPEVQSILIEGLKTADFVPLEDLLTV